MKLELVRKRDLSIFSYLGVLGITRSTATWLSDAKERKGGLSSSRRKRFFFSTLPSAAILPFIQCFLSSRAFPSKDPAVFSDKFRPFPFLLRVLIKSLEVLFVVF